MVLSVIEKRFQKLSSIFELLKNYLKKKYNLIKRNLLHAATLICQRIQL